MATDVTITHPDRVVLAASNGRAPITKAALVEYYGRLDELAVTHLADRPLVLERHPDGIDGSGFFQKNVPDHLLGPASGPDAARAAGALDAVQVPTADGGVTRYPVVHDAVGLERLANFGTVAFHALLSRAADPQRPVEVIIDLDPADDDLDPVRGAAREVRAVLEDVGLCPRVRSSGSRGLHVIVDVNDPDATFDLTRTFARRVAELVEDRGPFTLEHRTARRGGRLFLDVLRNAPANHAVASYSLRSLPDAPVAAPLDWDEALSSRFHPRRITMRNIWRRLGQLGDPWTDAPRTTTTIADALESLR